jgi:hypothetical protein
MTLAELRRQNPELFPKEFCSWAEHHEFFAHESAGEACPVPQRRWDRPEGWTPALPAVTLALMMVQAIREKANCGFLNGRYFRTGTEISSRAIVVIRCTPERTIEIESWAKDSRHRLLADW